MDLGLADKVVVVTGASKGIGYACAEASRREGARVALVSRSAANLGRGAGQVPGDAARAAHASSRTSRAPTMPRAWPT